jgi:uncharacterized SAM-binding protein YcdF (DUF218 family)
VSSVPWSRLVSVRRLVALLGVGLGGWCAVAAGLDHHGLSQVAEGPYDAVVVAGAGVMPGGVPSVALYERSRRAAALMAQGQAPILALTGGVGDHPPSEAEVARQLVVGWGVDEAVIVLEDRSTSTEENAANLAELLDARRVLVVTDGYHVFRVRRVFGHHFAQVDAVGVRSTPWVRTRGALREVAAIGWYALTGRL